MAKKDPVLYPIYSLNNEVMEMGTIITPTPVPGNHVKFYSALTLGAGENEKTVKLSRRRLSQQDITGLRIYYLNPETISVDKKMLKTLIKEKYHLEPDYTDGCFLRIRFDSEIYPPANRITVDEVDGVSWKITGAYSVFDRVYESLLFLKAGAELSVTMDGEPYYEIINCEPSTGIYLKKVLSLRSVMDENTQQEIALMQKNARELLGIDKDK